MGRVSAHGRVDAAAAKGASLTRPSYPHLNSPRLTPCLTLSDLWLTPRPQVLFSVHRSLLAGRDTKDPFAGVVTSSDEPHPLKMSREEIDVGKPTFGINLPTCRHSQALDCAEDSEAWLEGKKTGGGGAKGPKVPRANLEVLCCLCSCVLDSKAGKVLKLSIGCEHEGCANWACANCAGFASEKEACKGDWFCKDHKPREGEAA